MRVLWVDTDENPWTDPNGWRVIEDFGLQLTRVGDISEAHALIAKRNFDLLLVRAELDGGPELVLGARRALKDDPRRVILASSTWPKEEFKKHSKSPGAAHRYARVPMPPEGFLGLVADLFGCSVEELAEFTLPDSEALSMDELRGAKAAAKKTASTPAPEPVAAAPAREREPEPVRAAPRARAKASETSEDAEVLRKYLRIKEEQLEISEGERQELSHENERLQKDAQQLQLRLRELEHLEGELTKKISQMEEERKASELQNARTAEEREREARHQAERVKGLEQRVSEADEKYENLRVRVRKDIRKIRENERDLEARLELLRKDSETLLKARDERVLELQRKIDALEFDLDQVQDSKVQAQMEAERYLAKLSRVARALHIATGMIEEDHISEDELDELEPYVGGAANAEEPKAAASTAGEGSGNSGEGEGGAGGGSMGAELPPADENADMAPAIGEELSPELAALANDGEPTQMLSAEALHSMEGEPESNSG